MTYRFRTMIERPDWNPPQCVNIEVTYDATEPTVRYNEDEVDGGVSECAWEVVMVKGPCGWYHNQTPFSFANAKLDNDPDFEQTIRDLCQEDFAQRYSGI